MELKRIDQLLAEGEQAAKNGLPFSACPYPYYSQHAQIWERGWMAHALQEVAHEAAVMNREVA